MRAPNVLYLMTDQHAAGVLGCASNDVTARAEPPDAHRYRWCLHPRMSELVAPGLDDRGEVSP